MKLSKQALNVLKILKEDKEKTVNEFENDGFDQSMVNRALLELEQESLVKSEEDEHDIVEITDKGEEIKESCSPEYSILNQLSDGSKPISELEGDTNIGIGKAKEKNWINIEDGVVSKTNKANELNKDPVKCKLEQENFDDELKRRGLVESDSVVIKTLKLTEKGKEVDLTEVEEDFNVESEVGKYEGGKEHVLRGTANRVKDVLVGMGFQEMNGPHVDSQFWINDCLFMPQDHPARTHWDQFALDLPNTENLPQNLVDKVRSAHKNGVGKYGEGYHAEWNQEVAESIDLRGHTTSLTMRHLSGYQKGSIEPPAKYFSVEKVYRNDTIDSTHLLEFFQIEGWVMAENLSAKDLMGTFKEFYSHFGIEEIEFKPHYNPYTEPSFELFGKHPETGEMIEIGNSGIFRKEVLEPLGVECDVMAWGLALERLLMLMYGFEDIRDVHGTLCDLELLRNTRVVK